MILKYLLTVVIVEAVVIGLYLAASKRFDRSKPGDDYGKIVDKTSDLIRVLYVFVLGFVIVTTGQQLSAAKQNASAESTSLAGVYWAAHAMPDPAHQEIQRLTREYTEATIDEEWPLMASESRLSDEVWGRADRLREEILAFHAADSREQAIQNDASGFVRDLYISRRQRVLDAQAGIPDLLWYGLIGGAALNLLLPLALRTKITTSTVVVMASTALVLASALFYLSQLDGVYSGVLHIEPDALRFLQTRFAHIT